MSYYKGPIVRSNVRAAAAAIVGVATALALTTRLQANAPAGRFVAISGGVAVQDTVTGLVWQQPDNGMTYTWANAPTACASPWRLPTVSELDTLVDIRASTATIDPIFTGTGSTFYWTSTPEAGNSTYAWYVSFNFGSVNTNSMGAAYRVRCVR